MVGNIFFFVEKSSDQFSYNNAVFVPKILWPR